MLLFLPPPFPPASSCEQTEESQTRPRRLRPHMPVMQPQLPSHGGQEEQEEEEEEGRAATLLSPVAASASPLLLPS